MKVYFGKAMKLSGNKLLEKYGMKIYSQNGALICVADAGALTDNEYSDFLQYANGARQQYLFDEKEYSKAVFEKDPKVIAQEFKPVVAGGIFGKKNFQKQKQRQMYDCLAILLFNEFLDQEY